MTGRELEGIASLTMLDDLRELAQSYDLTLSETAQLVERVLGYARALKVRARRIFESSAGKLSEEEAIERALAELSIPPVDMLVKDIISVGPPASTRLSLEAKKMVRLPFQFYSALFHELGTYVDEFSQLSRDYSREIRGEELLFAVDFSELGTYMYPQSPGSPRSEINKYVLDKAEDSFTLMPGAVGELLGDLKESLPPHEVIGYDPLQSYKAVARFVNDFPSAIDDKERVIKLYIQAEMELRKALGELFNCVMKGENYTSFVAVSNLMDKGKLTPVDGVQVEEIPGSLLKDVRRKAGFVKSYLDFVRPERTRNNQVDTIDFMVTLLLNRQKESRGKRYISIYTQSSTLLEACKRDELRWDKGFLVRGAQYFKLRTRLQELVPSSLQSRREFVVEWREECKQLRREIMKLVDLERELPQLTQPTLELLERLRRFDQECRTPLSFTGEVAGQEERARRQEAEKLYKMLKDSGEFRKKLEHAYEFLQVYLIDLQNRVELFVPEEARTEDAKEYMEALLKWLGLEETERDKD